MTSPDPHSYAGVKAAWAAETTRLGPEILRDPVAYALANITRLLIDAADAELAAARDQLGVISAWLCPDAYLEQAAADSPDAAVGQILRGTGTGRELVMTAGGWEPVP